ncbi:MAG TPA: hypothetical protein PLI09_08245 [Candidatus Hydrogenedentes bacterium]|nr:hypothetical protein [Candidatus Hydrogenedentota bacterium]
MFSIPHAYKKAVIQVVAILFVVICLFSVTGCCCFRWSLDPVDHPVEIVKTGAANFILELYQFDHFDEKHHESGKHMIVITSTDSHPKPVPRNYVRSLMLQAADKTQIELFFDNKVRAVGTVRKEDQRTLSVPDLFEKIPDRYMFDKRPGCRIDKIVVHNDLTP